MLRSLRPRVSVNQSNVSDHPFTNRETRIKRREERNMFRRRLLPLAWALSFVGYAGLLILGAYLLLYGEWLYQYAGLFIATGGSNMEPGLVGAVVTAPISAPVVALPAIASVAGGAMSTASRGFKGITQDGKRTGRAIAATIHDRLALRNLVGRKAYPKRGGRLATPFGEVDLPDVGLP